MTNPYLAWVRECETWLARGKGMPLGGIPSQYRAAVDPAASKGLIFSPHPDDECIVGALPLRMAREAGIAITNIAVTLGSKKDRRQGRWQELQNACAFLGWGVQSTVPEGLEKISLKGRAEDPENWKRAVEVIIGVLAQHQPKVIFVPHAEDWNASHIGTHHLVMEALAAMPASFSCLVVETEFWAAMDTPNVMMESSAEDVAELVAATSFHVGEVQRNPYYLTLPAWMQDNVRRGGELVGGQGGSVPDFSFCTLYRVRGWKQGALMEISPAGRMIAKGQSMRDWCMEVRKTIGI
jgi:LmbE family N-acetylglucosaminyl deacetylase